MHRHNRDVRAPLDLFHRTYHSLLRSTGEIQIQALIEPYMAYEPSLHSKAREEAPDLPAITYTSLRLPACIDHVRLVLLGQSHEVFARHGFGDVLDWQPVSAPGRRRKMFYDGQQTLAVLIASPSDVDDLIPMLVAFQIEWNKLHTRLSDPALVRIVEQISADRYRSDSMDETLLDALGFTPDEAQRLHTIWGTQSVLERLCIIAQWKKRFAVRMLGGSLLDYERATQRWWWHIEESMPHLPFRNRPVYFVSSNTHSLINLLSGFALRNRDELLQFIRTHEHASLLDEYNKIMAEQVSSSVENFFYYVQKKYQSDPSSRPLFEQRAREETALGITRIASSFYVDVPVQVIELGQLDLTQVDPRLRLEGCEHLQRSDAIILNIDYPLGLAAHSILKMIARTVQELRGVYVMGKAATLNGKVGDVLIPKVVYDEHTGNTYSFVPIFSAADIEPYLAYGSVLDNQKAVTAYSTFLQNASFFDALYRDFFTDIEMESGPYLNAIYEHTTAERYPNGEIISLLNPPFDLGFLHYASDTPNSKGINLGT